MVASPTFDFSAFMDDVDRERQAQGLRWVDLADVLWQQSSALNERLGDAPL